MLAGCGHFTKKDFSKFREGQWEGKALIRDRQSAKSGIVNLKIKAVTDEKLRMDFTSPVGTHIASVLMLGEEVQYLNVADKALYKSKASVESFKNILLVPIDPKAFYGLLFDRPIENKNWTCTKDDNGMVASCADNKSGLAIEWKSREGDKRTIGIQHKLATVQINLYNFEDTVENPEKAFNLTAPATFKIKKM
jgi:hypothetical protein